MSLMCVYYLYACLYTYYIPYVFCKVWALKALNQMLKLRDY